MGIQARGQSAALFERLLQDLSDPVLAIRPDHSIAYANPATETVFGYPPEALVGEPLDRLLPQEHRQAHQGYVQAFGSEGPGKRSMGERARIEGLHRDGSRLPLKATIGRLEDGPEPLYYAIVTDATPDLERERALQREAALTRALSQLLELFGEEAPPPERVFAETCRILVEVGGLQLAWVGQPDGDRILRPAASFGESTDYLEQVQVSVDPEAPSGQGPGGLAFRQGRPQAVLDVHHAPALEPFLPFMASKGIRALAAFPLFRGGQAVGTLNLYAPTPGFFQGAFFDLLERLARAVSTALDRYDHEAERRHLTEIIEATPDLVGIADPRGETLYINPAAQRFLGKGPRPGPIWQDHPEGAPRKLLEEALSRAARDGRWEGEVPFLDAQGREVPHSQLILAHRNEEGAVERFSTIARDIEDRKAKEAALEAQFREALDIFIRFLEMFSPDLMGHCRGVAEQAVALGTRLGLTPEEQEDLYYAGLLHDLGFVGLPPRLRAKSYSLLSTADRQQYRQHPTLGEAALVPLPRLDRAARFIRHHHEYWDGSGYPDGLAGEAIPYGAQVLGLVTEYHDLLEGRIFVRRMSRDQALQFLREQRGHRFDPEVTDAFLALLGKPAGAADTDPATPQSRPPHREKPKAASPADPTHTGSHHGGSPGRKRPSSKAESPPASPEPPQPAAEEAPASGEEIRIQSLAPGMVLAQDLTTAQGMLLLSAGATLDNRAIQKIQRLREHIPRTTRVHRPDSPEAPG